MREGAGAKGGDAVRRGGEERLRGEVLTCDELASRARFDALPPACAREGRHAKRW